MRKGTVLSIENNMAIVFTNDCGLVRIPGQPDMVVGREILLPEMSVQPVHREEPRLRFWKPAMAAMLLLIVVTAGLWFGQGRWSLAAYARLSVDVNPGIELVLDRRLQVRDVVFFNEEARLLAACVQLEGLEWREAIERWAGILIEKQPEKLERMLLGASLSQHDEAFSTQLREMAGTGNTGALAGVDVWILYATDPDVARLAAKNGLSVGRQMLLNLDMDQQLGWSADQMAQAPLGDWSGLMSENPDPDQDSVIARIRERSVTRNTSEESSTTGTSGNAGQTTGKSSAGYTSGGNTTGQTSGEKTEKSTEESATGGSTTGGSQTGGSTAKESSSGQTTGSTSGKTTSGSGTGSTTNQSQSGPAGNEPGKST